MTEARIFGEHDERTKEQMARCMQYGSVRGGVLCADGHLGYAQPVGGVIAYDEHISVSGVGFDIACGNMAVKLDVPRKAIEDRIEPILQDIAANVSFGRTRCSTVRYGRNPTSSGASNPWRASSSAPSARATTTSTCSRTRKASSGSVSTSDRVAWGTKPRPAS